MTTRTALLEFDIDLNAPPQAYSADDVRKGCDALAAALNDLLEKLSRPITLEEARANRKARNRRRYERRYARGRR